jgi:hypothetical protein
LPHKVLSGQPCRKTSLKTEAKTMSPSFFNHLLLISLFELKRAFATRRGLLSLITFAVVWYFILLYPLRFAAELLVQEKGLKKALSFLDFIGLD